MAPLTLKLEKFEILRPLLNNLFNEIMFADLRDLNKDTACTANWVTSFILERVGLRRGAVDLARTNWLWLCFWLTVKCIVLYNRGVTRYLLTSSGLLFCRTREGPALVKVNSAVSWLGLRTKIRSVDRSLVAVAPLYYPGFPTRMVLEDRNVRASNLLVIWGRHLLCRTLESLFVTRVSL